MLFRDVVIGALFSIDGVWYIKIAEDEFHNNAVWADNTMYKYWFPDEQEVVV